MSEMAAPGAEAAVSADRDHEHWLIHLHARKGWSAVNVAELWQFRDLLWFLALRDIKVRYKQTALGAAWAIIQPLTTMVIFSLFFGYLGGMSDRVESGVPYPIYTFCALLPWQLFAHAMTAAGGSLVESQNLITKVYFPRLLIPFASVVSGLVDFAIAMALLILMMLYYAITPTWTVIFLPVLVGLATFTALSVGLWLSALSTMYRDFRYTISFLVQIWLFITPVAYPMSIVPQKWQTLYALNPMAGVVEGFRWALLGREAPPLLIMAVSTAATAALFFSGVYYFRRVERNMADWV